MISKAARPAEASEELTAPLVGSVASDRCTGGAETDGDGRPCDTRDVRRLLRANQRTGH